MARAAKFLFTVEQGGETSYSWGLTDSNGDPVDLTDATFAGEIRKSATSELGATMDFSISTPATAGVFTMSVSESEGGNLRRDEVYEYDVFLTESGSPRRKILKGPAVTDDNVTT